MRCQTCGTDYTLPPAVADVDAAQVEAAARAMWAMDWPTDSLHQVRDRRVPVVYIALARAALTAAAQVQPCGVGPGAVIPPPWTLPAPEADEREAAPFTRLTPGTPEHLAAVLDLLADDLEDTRVNHAGVIGTQMVSRVRAIARDARRSQPAPRTVSEVDRLALALWWAGFDGPAHPSGDQFAEAFIDDDPLRLGLTR